MPDTRACAALFLALAIAPSALLAQAPPNCQNPQTQTDMNICAAHGFMARGGSMESMLVGTCLAELTRKRTGELKDLAKGLGN